MELFPGCFRKTLDNRVEIIGQEERQSKSISIGLWFKRGSRDEHPDESGITHLIEHLLFRGTENRTAFQITRDVDQLGGHINGSTSKEYLMLSLRLLPESLSEGIDILTDLALNPLFREEDFELEKNVVVEEIRSSRDNHQSETIRFLQEAIWGGASGLSLPVTGTEDTLTELTRKKVRNRFGNLSVPEQMTITAAGDLGFSNLTAKVEDSFAEIGPNCVQEDVSSESKNTTSEKSSGKVKKNWRDINQLHCALGVEGLAEKDEDRFALEMLNVILGQGMSSRLFRKVRKQHGLAYQVTTNTQYFSDTGLFLAYGAMAPGNLDKFLELVREELDDLRNNPVTPEELGLAKKKTKGNLVLGLESNRAIMGRLGIKALHKADFLSVDEVIDKIEDVTREDIQKVARKVIKEKNLNYSLLGPKVENVPVL